MGHIVIQITKQAQQKIEQETRKANTLRIRRGEPMVKVTDVLAALEASWKEVIEGLVTPDAYVLAEVRQNSETGVKLVILAVGSIAAIEAEPAALTDEQIENKHGHHMIPEIDYPVIGHSIVEGEASAE